jgi:outer membrane protein OmpA-like peptidoglycan-associated protein
MLIIALIALGAGAVAGIYLATRHFLRKRLPASVALLHGLGGATGFALVLLTVVREPAFRPAREVLYLLIATVLLGAFNLLFHVRKIRHRTSLILLHGLTAVTSATMLIRAIVLHAAPVEEIHPPSIPSAAPAVPVASASAPAPQEAVAAAVPTESAAKPAPVPFAVDEHVREVLSRPIPFASNTTSLSSDQRPAIAAIAKVLAAHPEVTLVEVQGHADERGDESRNLELTRARAQSVVDQIVAAGVTRGRLHAAAYAARCPSDESCRRSDPPESCHGPDAWQRDRRVTFTVLRVNSAPFRGELVCERGADLVPSEDRMVGGE